MSTLTHIHREEITNTNTSPLTYTQRNPSSSSSSPITVSPHLDSTFLTDPSTTPHIGSASGSFQNDAGFLTDNSSGSADAASSEVFGFYRPEFRQSQLAGTVQFYERHVFLCYKSPKVWPTRIDAAEFDRLPRLLSAAVNAKKGDMRRETRLTICEGHDGTETSNGDVLIFPDMIRYRRLTHFDIDTFVEEVLVKDGEWLPGTPERLKGSYIFVCSHGSRDRRCGVCGPVLVSRFKEEIELRGLQGKVSVSPCSHIGGHKYAGNVIIFGSDIKGLVSGHWYGYVSPDDVPLLLEQHVGKGVVVDSLWRGQMGLSEEEQIRSLELRLKLNGEASVGRSNSELTQMQTSETNEMNFTSCRSQNEKAACCRENGTSCCQKSDGTAGKIAADGKGDKRALAHINSGKGSGTRKTCTMPTWFDSWEREDTYAALAVVCAAASVAFAYSCYKNI